ncbi:L-aspartate oxidase [Humisphaera borealis]|uniref:L-aspartate oxidase n=1 Tax=Humisphaera borealis TaxID=2807512 RepID=A0A7M2WQC5_9BACT|nr:L-aspartate oxidase [Humisphaera borealis]QOV87727.1 L-aspartate oxidase [Humisphaera borealis]
MFEALTQRRYLLPFKASRLPQQFTDVLVIGGGVAGLRAAIAAADGGCDVLLLTKDTIDESNTWYAQGGIAAVLQPADSYASHVSDTEKGGAGLCDHEAVEIVVKEGPQRVLELLQWGINFDKDASKAHGLAFTLEGGHSFARILHAYGDSTGKELAQTLINTVRARENIRIGEKTFVVDLITDDHAQAHQPPGRCVGVLALVRGQLNIIWAKTTILASGGAGQLYRESTNPKIATADGHAMAWRAGAAVKDMEMVQFHPTTLYVAGASRALITEAVRGEGAYLVDRNGYRFMKDYHEMGELAPRDVVSRAIVEQIRKTNFTHVYLDVRHLPPKEFRERFPQLAKLVDQFEIDPAKDVIPIHPAAHYMIGGVDVDLQGRSSLAGLYAVGEASCTGLHGANRLGSNSLLEGLTFGARAGLDAVTAVRELGAYKFPQTLEHRVPRSTKTELDIIDVKSSLRSVMWRNVGIERTGDRLAETREIIAFWSRYVMDKVFDPQVLGEATAVQGWEVQNMLAVCALITSAAYTRTESRGAHYRMDYPTRDDAHWRLHLLWRRPMETPIPSMVD